MRALNEAINRQVTSDQLQMTYVMRNL